MNHRKTLYDLYGAIYDQPGRELGFYTLNNSDNRSGASHKTK